MEVSADCELIESRYRGHVILGVELIFTELPKFFKLPP